MREGRRQRLGLLEGTEGTVQDTYLDRIITDAEIAESAAGPFNYLKLGDDANVNVRDQRYVGDAYDYYLGGGLDDYTEGVDLETGQPDLTGGQMIDTGGGGGGRTLPGFDVDSPKNTDFEQNLIDQGIGVQAEPGAPISAPGEGMLTQEAIDDLANYPITQPDQGVPVGEAYAPIDTVDYSEFDDLEADPGAQAIKDFAPEQGFDLDSIGESIASFAGTAYDKFNKSVTLPIVGKVNLASAAAKSIINKLAGGPISLVVDALSALGLEPGRSDASEALGEQYGMDDIGRLTGGPMAGYNVDSAFGDIRQATIDRINTRKQNNLDTEELEDFLEQIDAYETGAPQEDVEAADTISDLKISTGIQAADDDSGREMRDQAAKEEAAAKAQRDFQAAVAKEEADKRAQDAAAARVREQARQADQKSGRSEPSQSRGVSPGAGNSRR